MNMQAMLKQAQKIQQEMVEEKHQFNERVFSVENELVSIKMKGNRQLIELKLKQMSDDQEMIEDMIMVATNQILKEIDGELQKQMDKYTQGMPGMF